jgi:hypothetical protein
MAQYRSTFFSNPDICAELLDQRGVTDDERSVTLGAQNAFTTCGRFAISCRNHLHIQPKVCFFRWSIQCIFVALCVNLRRINSCADPLAISFRSLNVIGGLSRLLTDPAQMSETFC